MSLFNDLLIRLTKPKVANPVETPNLIVLEERVLYSAAPIPTDVFEPADLDFSADEAPEVPDLFTSIDGEFANIAAALDQLYEVEFPTPSQSLELVVIDQSVTDYRAFVDDLIQNSDPSRQFEILFLDTTQDGIAQLTEIISQRRGVDAIHLVSHGSDGALQLGNTQLNTQTLDRYQDQISQWKYSLDRDADILLYGCDVASTEVGEAFVRVLAELTESDVAASSDITGHVSLGGDWDFEVQVGTLETQAAFSMEVQSAWESSLLQFATESEGGTAKALAVDDSGNHFIAVTANYNQTVGDDIMVYAMDSGGTELFTPFVANTTTAGDQKWASIAVSSSADRLVVVWTQDDLGGNLGVFASVYDTSGTVIKSEFQVDTPGTDGNDASVAIADDGTFIVAWEGSGPEDADGIYARRYDLNGTEIEVSPFSVNNGIGTAGPQSNPDVAMNATGEFVIAWDNYVDSDTASQIIFQGYNSSAVAQYDGATDADPIMLSSHASVDINDSGQIVFAYTADTTDTAKSGGSGALLTSWSSGAAGVTYSSTGAEIRKYTLNSTIVGAQLDATALIFNDGSTAFSWEGAGVSGASVYTRTFDNTGVATTPETQLGSDLIYNAGTDTPSAERGALIVDPDDVGYTVWNKLANAVIAKAPGNSFVGGMMGGGYQGGAVVEGFHVAAGFSVGNSAPSMDASPVTVDLNEFSPNGTVVYDVDATDAEGTTLVYAIDSGDPDSIFTIDSAGIITVADSAKLDYDTTTSHRLVVTVTDQAGAGLTVAKIVTVEVEPLAAVDGNLNINEDAIYVFSGTNFQDNDGDTVTRIQIETLPVGGTLLLRGEGVTAGQQINLTEINQGTLVYLPNQDGSGADSFTFRLGDAGGISSTTGTITLNVAAVADLNLIGTGDQLVSMDGAAVINDTILGTQTNSKVAALAGGGYVVIWESDQGNVIYQQRYDASGNEVGGQTLVDDDLSGDQSDASVTGLKDGGYLVVWERDMGSHTNLYAQRFNAGGNEVDIDGVSAGGNSQFVVQQNAVGNQFLPVVTALSDGGFVIAWGTNDPAIDADTGIAARIYDASGFSSDEFIVNEVTSGTQRDVTIAALENNRFVVGWVDQSVNGFDVKARVFDAGDPTSGAEFTLNDVTANRQSDLSITGLANGEFVAIWQANSAQDGSGQGLFAKVFDANGTTRIAEFVVNQVTAGHQENGRIVALADGGFLAVYESSIDGDSTGIVGRRFPPSSDWTGIGDEFVINTQQYGDQTLPDAALLSDGSMVVTWSSADGDEGGANFDSGIFLDRFEFGVIGNEDTAISIELSTNLADHDGSESVQSITVSGVPLTATLSDGGGNTSSGASSVDITGWDLSALTITPDADSHEDFVLTVQTVTEESSNSDTQTTTEKLHIIVQPSADSLTKADWNTTTSEDNTLDLTTNQLTSGYASDDEVVLTHVPDSSFNQTTLPPGTSGPNLVWDNAVSGGDIVFDPSVTYTPNSGSALLGMQGAMVLNGNGGGIIDDSTMDTGINDEAVIELWIKPDSLSGQHILFEWGDENEGIALYQDGSQVLFKVHTSSTVGGSPIEPYTLVADGLSTTEFNQITFMVSAEDTTILGDTGRTPDFQLYLNGELRDQLIDAPGYTQKIHLHTYNIDAGLGTRVGTATGDNVAYTDFEGQIAKFETFGDLAALDEIEARYQNEQTGPTVANIQGQSLTPGTTVTLPSGALVIVNEDGSLRYDPNEAFESLDSGGIAQDNFTYTIQNTAGGSDSVTVTIDITGEDAIVPIDLSSGVEINAEGNDAYFLADNGDVMNGLSELTVELMISSDSASTASLLSYQTTDQPNGGTYFDDFLIEYQSGGTLDIYLPNNGGTATLNGLSGIDYSTLMDGQLHNLAFRWDGVTGDWAVLVDGVISDQGTGAAIGESLASGGELVFGQDQDSPNGDFDSTVAFQGTYHDIRIWDHERSVVELADDYANKFASGSAPSGLLANWQFTDLSGGGNDTITNIVSGGNNLTLQHASGVGFTTGSATDVLRVPENSADGTQVGIVVPTDIDGSSGHTFSLLDNASGRFAIDTDTGEITIASTGLINHEDNSSHSITVQVTDGDGGSYQEVITIDIVDVNDAVSIATNTGTSVTRGSSGNVITNSVLNEGDEDISDFGTAITYTLDAGPTRGELRLSGVLLGDGDTFTQNDIDSLALTYNHTDVSDTNDSFDFTIRDGMEDGVASTSATFNITVNTVDSPPTSASNTLTIPEDASYTIQESDFSFSDSDSDTLSEVLIVTAPLTGTFENDGVTVNDGDTISLADIQSGNLQFTPAANEYGTNYASFEFRVRASNAAYQAGSSTITFDVTNDFADLSVTDDSYSTVEDTDLTRTAGTGLLSNDDPDSGTYTVIDYSNPEHGTVTVNPDGSFTYTPDENYHGADSFDYAVTDANSGLVHYWSLSGHANDSIGSNHGTISGASESEGNFGTGLTFDETDDYVQIPDVTYANEFTLSFKFRLDDNTGSGYQYMYNHGVMNANNSLNVLLGESGSTDSNQLLTILSDANDFGIAHDLSFDASSFIDGNWHTYTLTVSDSGGLKVYIDGTEMVTATHGTDGTLNPAGDVYLGKRDDTPNNRYFGGDLDSVSIYDKALSPGEVSNLTPPAVLQATVSINVTPFNDAPTAHSSVFGVVHGGTGTFGIERSLLYTADDVDGDTLTATVLAGPSNGTLLISADGTFSYTHDGTATTFDTFTYTVSDGNGGSTTASVRIHIDAQGTLDTNEFVVNQDTTDHPFLHTQMTDQADRYSNSAIAVDSDGDYVVVWSSAGQDSEFDLMMRRYDFSGAAISEQTIISQTAAAHDYGGTISMADDGSFVVAWVGKANDGSQNVYARRFDALGNALGGEFRVTEDFDNTMADDFDFGDQVNPSIATNSSGDFVIAWEGGRETSGGTIFTNDVYIRHFAADGSPSDIRVVNDNDGGVEKNISVALDDSGDAVVVWDDSSTIYGRQMLANGSRGAEFSMPLSDRVLEVKIGSLDMNSSSLVAFSYQTRISDGMGGSHWEVHLQVIDPTNPVFVNSPDGNQYQTGDQIAGDVSFHDDGTLVMTWHGQSTTNVADTEDVFGRRFRVDYNDDGDPIARAVSDEFLISQSTGSQTGASVAGLDSENFVVAWTGEDVTGSKGIYARQYGNQVSYSATGFVYEDVNGDAQLTDALGAAGVTVKLYRDDGNGTISAGDELFREVVTDGSGNYTFTGLQATTQYWIVVDSKTVNTSGTLNSGYTASDLWAEQTYGDGGAKIGGETSGVSDDASQLATSQHRTLVTFASADQTGIEFGFSFNTVTNSLGGDSQDDDSGLNERSVQGSLRQFITNANAIDGANEMHFVPGTAADRTPSGNQIWEIEVSVALPELTDEGTVIDGRAYSSDGITRRNANTALLGHTGTVGVGADGVAGTGDEYTFTGLDAPELEISDLADVTQGLVVTASDTEISYISIHGFGATLTSSANIRVTGTNVTNVHIHDNVIGARAHEFVAPNTAAQQSHNILVDRADSGLIENNLIGFSGNAGILIKGSSSYSAGANNWVIEHNEIRSNGMVRPKQDGISLTYDTSGTIVRQNLIAENAGHGVDSWRGLGDLDILDNTLTGNGVGNVETGGIRLFGEDNLVRHNVVADHVGPGVNVVGRNTSRTPEVTASTRNLISQNSFYDNGGLGIDLADASSSLSVLQQGDGHSINGVASNVDAGNTGLDYPLIMESSLSGGVLQVSVDITGSFDEIEIYSVDAATVSTAGGFEFGQGAIYLGTLTAADLTYNSTSGLYSGALATPASGWPAAITGGGKVTAVAMRSSNTSEFGTTADVQLGGSEPVAVNSAITATEDVGYVLQRSDFLFTDLTNSQYFSIRIDALPSGGTLTLNGTAVTAGTVVLATDIDDGDLIYTADLNQNGSPYDSLQFSVNDGVYHSTNVATLTIAVNAVNDAPEFTSSADFTMDENQTVAGTVTTTDVEGDTRFYTIRGGDDHALFSINSATGELSFIVAPNYELPTDFNGDNTYEVVVRANDGQSGITDQSIEVHVNPVNDNTPDLQSLTLGVNEGTSIVPVTLVDADLPGDSVTATITGGADASLFTFDNVNQHLVFNQSPNYESPHDFDGNNEYVVQLLLNDNEGRTQTRTVTIEVHDISEDPIARNDSYTLDEGDWTSGVVTTNDEYSGPATVSLISGPDYGHLTLNSDGTFVYTHGGADVYNAEFVYRIQDNTGWTDRATVSLTVNPIDDAPVAQDDAIVAVGNVEIDITKTVLGNDYDTDSRIEGFQIITQPENGTVIIDGDGKLIFVPDTDFDGQTQFEYSIESAGQTSAAATVVVDVLPAPTSRSGDNDNKDSDQDDEVQEDPPTDEGDLVAGNEGNNNQEGSDPDGFEGSKVTQAKTNISDSLADTNNTQATSGENTEINLYSEEYSSFTTYVYSSDVELIESQSGYERLAQNSRAVSQFNHELLASNFLKELDAAKDQFYTKFDISMPSLAMAGTSFLTVGYLAWMVRGGILLTTFMSSIPAWRMLDPLAVLESASAQDVHDDQSISQIVDS